MASHRLFFNGKELEEGKTLFDYKINLGHTIQLFPKRNDAVAEEDKSKDKEENSGATDINYFLTFRWNGVWRIPKKLKPKSDAEKKGWDIIFDWGEVAMPMDTSRYVILKMKVRLSFHFSFRFSFFLSDFDVFYTFVFHSIEREAIAHLFRLDSFL